MSKLRCCFCGRGNEKFGGGIQSKTTEEIICNECISEVVLFRVAESKLVEKLEVKVEQTTINSEAPTA